MFRVKSLIQIIIIFGLINPIFGCGSTNILESFATESDLSLLEDAKVSMNASDWASAIASFDKMSAEFLAKREIKMKHAAAYAGRCGFDFMTFVENLTTIGTTKLFRFLMQSFPTSTAAKIDDCESAETIIKEISTNPSERSIDENTFMAFLGFAKMGVILNANADSLDNDGVPDAGFDSCSVAKISDDHVKKFGTGLANSLTSLAAPGVSLGGDQMTDLSSICALIDSEPGLGAAYNFCSTTDVSGIDANKVQAIRTIVGEGVAIGIGSCTGGPPNDIGNCICP